MEVSCDLQWSLMGKKIWLIPGENIFFIIKKKTTFRAFRNENIWSICTSSQLLMFTCYPFETIIFVLKFVSVLIIVIQYTLE